MQAVAGKKNLVRNTFSLPITGCTIQQLEGLQYDKSLNLNMENYIIEFHPKLNSWQPLLMNLVNFINNKVPIGGCISGDIFQY